VRRSSVPPAIYRNGKTLAVISNVDDDFTINNVNTGISSIKHNLTIGHTNLQLSQLEKSNLPF
jgi:hypothetical protein